MAWRGLCLLALVAGFAPPSPQRSAPCRPRRPPTRLHVEATVEEPVEDEETPEEDEEIWLNPAAAQHPTRTLGEALMLGDVVLCVRDVADADELEALRDSLMEYKSIREEVARPLHSTFFDAQTQRWLHPKDAAIELHSRSFAC